MYYFLYKENKSLQQCVVPQNFATRDEPPSPPSTHPKYVTKYFMSGTRIESQRQNVASCIPSRDGQSFRLGGCGVQTCGFDDFFKARCREQTLSRHRRLKNVRNGKTFVSNGTPNTSVPPYQTRVVYLTFSRGKKKRKEKKNVHKNRKILRCYVTMTPNV